jgi:hypothetical protein
VLRRTGDRLRAFAASLNLPFGFHPLLLSSFPARLAADRLELDLHPDEMLAINCVLFLHRLRSEELADFLRWVKSLSPDVVIIAEREATTIGDDDLPRKNYNPRLRGRCVASLSVLCSAENLLSSRRSGHAPRTNCNCLFDELFGGML